jgi:prepilin-type N-terminal cleavage/methylation domain-containing protein/prepilin-type processing-associated H-X9-DG protein
MRRMGRFSGGEVVRTSPVPRASPARLCYCGRVLHRPRGFTLLELLVALAVIAVLAALVFPLAGTVSDAGRGAKCVQHLRQIGAGLVAWCGDNNGEFPASAYGGTTVPTAHGGAHKWMDAIFPYVRAESVFLCPADAGAAYRHAGALAAGESSTDYGSYGMNGAYRNAGDGQTPPRSAGAAVVHRAQVAEPAATVWVTDTANRQEANGSFGFTWADAAAHPAVQPGPPRQLDKIIERHRGRANVLFCDGRVEAVRLEHLTEGRTVVDPVDGSTKFVWFRMTVESD